MTSWVGESGICTIFAPPRTGKTALLTTIGNHYAFDRERNKYQRLEITKLNAGGFNIEYPRHCVRANYKINFRKFGYSLRPSRKFKPFHFGYKNSKVDVQFMTPYDILLVTEGQKYFNSRKSKNYPAWQSRAMEQIGHNNLLLFIDVQRPNLIDVNIRELSKFIEVVSLNVKCDENGKINKMVWVLKLIDNSFLLDKYLGSGKTLEVPTVKISIDYNVFMLYQSKCCQPRFFDGHFNDSPDESVYPDVELTVESFKEYLLEFAEDEIPKGFYEKE